MEGGEEDKVTLFLVLYVFGVGFMTKLVVDELPLAPKWALALIAITWPLFAVIEFTEWMWPSR